jgi:hypothetical protein
MALAHIAWILASMGKKVLVMDWDLESPGLHRYFHPFLGDEDLRSYDGIIDLVRKYADATRQSDGSVDRLSELAQVQSCAVSLEWDFPNGGTLDFVPAGRQNKFYSTLVITFDWDSFWSRLGGGSFLEALARDVRSNYDFVLIDSRTGLSDTAGICAVQLPDIVVCCFSMNRQSIDGSVAVATSIRHQRAKPIRLLPVPMRVDEDDVRQLKGNPGSYVRQRFDRLVSDSGNDDVDSYWTSAAIPYKKPYALRLRRNACIVRRSTRTIGYPASRL